MIPGQAQQFFEGAAAASGGSYQIDRSLRFNNNDSAYLSRTFSAGNRKTWTWSSWVKRSRLGVNNQPFMYCRTGSDDNTYLDLRFGPSSSPDSINLSGYATNFRTTDAVFRDSSAWFHLVAACDTTQSSNSDRVKFYINGVQQTFSTESTISQGSDLGFNQAEEHRIGDAFGGYLAEVHFIDGLQLAASDFGETDANGVWQPKEYEGDYNVTGVTYSANSSGLSDPTNAWDGSTSTGSYVSVSGTLGQFTSLSIPVSSSMRVRVDSGSDGHIYINGSQNTAFTAGAAQWVTVTTPPATVTSIGVQSSSGPGILAVEADGVILKDITAGANGFYLKFDDNSSAAALGTDSSGGSNTWTVNNISVTPGEDNDSLIDTPTNYTAGSGNNGGNYATLNVLDQGTSSTISNGSLDMAATSTADNNCPSTIGMSSGKWYFEVDITFIGGTAGGEYAIGLGKGDSRNTSAGQIATSWAYESGGAVRNNGSNSSYGDSYTTGDVLGAAFDADSGTLAFYKNGVSQGTAATGLSGTYFFLVGTYLSTSTRSANFGQRPFAYTPPTGYVSLCTKNLPSPTVADGSSAMSATLYSGDGTNGRAITTGHGSDLVWIKARNQTDGHNLFDIVRGVTNVIKSNSTATELTESNSLTAFDSSGFTVGDNASNAQVNQSGFDYVAWSWDGGTSTVSNTDGSITSDVRANTSAGFSIVGYTGTGTAATIGHGLSAAPEFIIVKNRDTARPWSVFHQAITNMNSGYINLNSTSAFTGSYTGVWDGTDPTSSVFSVGTDNESNNSGDDFIAYCWTPVSQYSKFGSFVGTGSSSTAPFVFTGFRPSLIIFKASSDTSPWNIFDTARDPYNVVETGLLADSANAEFTGTDRCDILSNGFRVRAGSAVPNVSGVTYIYMAWAEHPFKTARAR